MAEKLWCQWRTNRPERPPGRRRARPRDSPVPAAAFRCSSNRRTSTGAPETAPPHPARPRPTRRRKPIKVNDVSIHCIQPRWHQVGFGTGLENGSISSGSITPTVYLSAAQSWAGSSILNEDDQPIDLHLRRKADLASCGRPRGPNRRRLSASAAVLPCRGWEPHFPAQTETHHHSEDKIESIVAKLARSMLFRVLRLIVVTGAEWNQRLGLPFPKYQLQQKTRRTVELGECPYLPLLAPNVVTDYKSTWLVLLGALHPAPL